MSESTNPEVRYFQSFRIVWDDRAEWTNYETAEECQAIIDGSVSRGGRSGVVCETRWSVPVTDRNRGILRPGMTPDEVAQPIVGG